MKEHGTPDTFSFSPELWDGAGSEVCLQALVQNSPIAIVILDAEHRYKMCNPAFVQLFQYTHNDLLNADLDTLITSPKFVQEAISFSHCVLGGSHVNTITKRRRKDGTDLDVEVHGVPLLVDGRLIGVYGLYQDHTERVRARTDLLAMSSRLLNLQLEERRRIARDLHDATSQELAILNWNLSRLRSLLVNEDQALKDLVEQTKDLAYQCSARIRSAAYLLHPPLLENEGLSTAVTQLAEGFEQRSGIRVMLDTPPELGRFPGETEVALFRTVQESLANVLRHSGSPIVRISLRKTSQWLKLAVADEGRNAFAAAFDNFEERGLGIRSMRERLEELGGSLTITSSMDGTTLLAAVPAGVC